MTDLNNTELNETELNESELNLEEMEDVAGGRVAAGGMRTKPAAKAGFVIHKISATDNLTRIAKQYGTTVKALMAANPTIKDKNLIRTGYYLYVPKKK